MNNDLLDRYFAGECTEEEAEIVRKWLAQPVPNETFLLSSSWKSIKKRTSRGVRAQQIAWVRYAAAACVLMTTSFAAIALAGQKDELLTNKADKHQQFATAGLTLDLPPAAVARIQNNFIKTTADLAFCGDARIHNSSTDDISMRLRATCGSVENAYNLTCRKGKKYLALQYHFKSSELMIVDEDRIFDLPLPLQRQAYQSLNI